ncbi:MAG: glycosyltransferase family 4 protein [Pyramidobacter sp.]|nr:glycosyltransferase family 4 protein [Pyramidobacter sp.]
MKIIQILPELELGGVERHVIDLSNELVKLGHEVLVVSAGGQMEQQLDSRVQRCHLPVHLKNPFTWLYCALRLAHVVRSQGWQILHAHSRVPAWIANWTHCFCRVPYVVTAHGEFGNKSPWIYAPYRKACRVICVSNAVQESMKSCFAENTEVILNGLSKPSELWDPREKDSRKLLFVGRLSSFKGLQDVLRVLPHDMDWTLDVVGDGPQKEEWASLCRELGISDRVVFRGYSDRVDSFMAHSSCLVFPSYIEGMPLTVARAVQIGLPVLASDIPPIAEMAMPDSRLIPPGDSAQWEKAIRRFLEQGVTECHFDSSAVPSLEKMVSRTLALYTAVISSTSDLNRNQKMQCPEHDVL